MRVNIVGTKWDMVLGQANSVAAGQMQFGFMDAEAHSITIHHETDPSWRLYLVLHEVLHALTFLGHLEFLRRDDAPHMDDEAKVDAVASLLADFLMSNELTTPARVDRLFDE